MFNSCLDVTSVDHKSDSGSTGKYFNFISTGNEGNYVIDHYRNGQLLQLDKTVIIWNNVNGGSTGNAHGRYESRAAHGDWEVGDMACDVIRE